MSSDQLFVYFVLWLLERKYIARNLMSVFLLRPLDQNEILDVVWCFNGHVMVEGQRWISFAKQWRLWGNYIIYKTGSVKKHSTEQLKLKLSVTKRLISTTEEQHNHSSSASRRLQRLKLSKLNLSSTDIRHVENNHHIYKWCFFWDYWPDIFGHWHILEDISLMGSC